MSATDQYSAIFLAVNKRAEEANLTFARLKVLMAIDSLGGDAIRRKIEAVMNVCLCMDIVKDLEGRGFVTYEPTSNNPRAPRYIYSLTSAGKKTLEGVLTGKESS